MKEVFFKEFHSKNAGIFFRIKKILFNKKTEYQKVLLFESFEFGKILVLDGLVMLTEKDEFIYHEMLVHPALSLIKIPKNILIIGGGDGGALRETLKHPVQKVEVVEIDRNVIEVCKKFLPWAKRAFEDSRVKIVIEDGFNFIKKYKGEKYSAIFVDSSDPVGPSKRLYKKEFFINLKNNLKEKGILVLQGESWFYHIKVVKSLFNILNKLFQKVNIYTAPVPSYPGGSWCFIFASDYYSPFNSLKREIKGLKFYNSELHKAAFSLPNFLSQTCELQKNILK